MTTNDSNNNNDNNQDKPENKPDPMAKLLRDYVDTKLKDAIALATARVDALVLRIMGGDQSLYVDLADAHLEVQRLEKCAMQMEFQIKLIEGCRGLLDNIKKTFGPGGGPGSSGSGPTGMSA